jgi:hypothetical protein
MRSGFTVRTFGFLLCIILMTGIVQMKCKGKDSGPRMNEPLIGGIYTADPSAHVFDGKLYIYPSHDIENNIPPDDLGSQFDMKDYHVYSISDFNSPVIDHGTVLRIADVPWAKKQFWAPDAAYKNGTYYLYFPAKDDKGIFRIGVATSAKPDGPFIAQATPIKGSFSIDPAVFVDDDGSAYMYFGGLMGGQLQCWVKGDYDPHANLPRNGDRAIGPRVVKMSSDMCGFSDPVREAVIVDENGKAVIMSDRNKIFFEASWMHKYNGLYYLSYSNGFDRSLVYATGTSPLGPFTFRGKILGPVVGWTTHHSIVKFGDRWYLFYHAADSESAMHLRRIRYAEIRYNQDGTIQLVVRN